MIVKSSVFELGAVQPTQWPTDGLREFAFVGRSNVGKSSLLNRILGRRALARVSQKPGKTQQINFFRINEQFRFADLPGYGYAAVSKTERAKFANMMDTYLSEREPLCRIFHLIDVRHDPSKDDVEIHQWLMTLGIPICIVATKSDKVSKSRVKPSVANIQKILRTPYPVIPVSTVAMTGLEQLWAFIEEDVSLSGVHDPMEVSHAFSQQRLASGTAQKHSNKLSSS